MATEQQTASSRPYYGIDNLVPPEVIAVTLKPPPRCGLSWGKLTI